MKTSNKMVSKKIFTVALLCACGGYSAFSRADEKIEFNTDVLGETERKSLDLSSFSTAGYVPPGSYDVKLKINSNIIGDYNVTYFDNDDGEGSSPCIPLSAVEKMGFKSGVIKKLAPWKNSECTNLTKIDGVTFKTDMKRGVLYINSPKEYLEYTDDNWAPSSMWDNGIPGLLLDYSANAGSSKNTNSNDTTSYVSGYGTVGANAGAWRGRADWQASNNSGKSNKLKWNQIYAYRALASIGAKLTLGSSFSTSDIFDSIRYAGASLLSDDRMLPPNLRGYAPQITGIAKTNAKVTLSQEGRVIYETQVPAGPFTISELSQGISGDIDVKVSEQDGTEQSYKVSTANVPYLSRAGSLRYKLYAGQSKDNGYERNNTDFAQGEFSYGLNNAWSLYGGSVLSKDYKALAMGFGRDLFSLGALALDVTQSRARVNNDDYEGRSYKISYAKRFDSTGSEITFAGYRFSEKNYMSFNEFLNFMSNPEYARKSKNMYTLTFSQQLEQLALSMYLQYTRQTYWDGKKDEQYSVSLSRNFDIGKLRGISASLSGYQRQYEGVKDNGVSASLTIPLGSGASVHTDTSVHDNKTTFRAGYSDILSNGDNYNMSTGMTGDNTDVSGYYNHSGDFASISANASHRQNEYSSAGLSIRGGLTATAEGAALHRSRGNGASRILVDTGNASGIPVKGYGDDAETNWFGKAVVADVSDYSKTKVSVNVKNMPENAEVTNSVDQAYLTEGAIGYRKFSVVMGEKVNAVIRLSDGTSPPFGAVVKNDEKQDVGMVGDDGQAYLSGVVPGKAMHVYWDGFEHCKINIPARLTSAGGDLLLPCSK